MNYNFKTIDTAVSISPMKTLFCKRIMDSFKKDMPGVIQPNRCFSNALIAAQWFREKGFDVEVVEGYMDKNNYAFEYARRMGISVYSEKHSRLNTEPVEHRFCKKGDKYFDPTIEFLFGFDMVKCFDYAGKRIYDYETLIDFAMRTEKDYGRIHFHSSISGLSYAYVGEKNIPIYWGHIDDNGEYVSPDSNPFDIFFPALNWFGE